MPEPVSAAEYEALAYESVRDLSPPTDYGAMALGLNLIRAANRMQYDLETKVHRPAGLTWAGFRILFTAYAMGPIAPQQLAHLSSVSAASVSSVLNTLEGSNLIVRTRSTTDGRSFAVELTDRGREVVTVLCTRNNQREIAWSRGLTAREQRTLVRLLRKLVAFHPVPPDATVERLVPAKADTKRADAPRQHRATTSPQRTAES
jgi:DNA-binding MarR family transcriptional regulator